MNKKIKVLLAIGQKQIEAWLQDKLAEYCDFVGIALHREQILDMINTTMPDVIILDVSLPTRQLNEMSVDLLIQKIKTTFRSCRPIVICGNQVPGDELLTRLVNRGVYDIAYGEKVKIQDVCDMIFNPRDYAYAATLQDLDAIDDKSVGLSKPKIVEQVKAEEQPSPYSPQSDSGIKWGNTEYGQESYNQAMYEQPSYSSNTPEYSEPGDTSILTSNAYMPRGIVFQPEESGNQIIKSSAGNMTVYTNDGYRANNVLKNPEPVVKLGKILVFTAARQGVGCTSSAINTAYAFAMENKKVLLLDATFGRSCIYQKLGLPENYGNTMEDVIRAYSGGNHISQMPLSKPQIKNSDGRGVSVPNTLKFLRFSENYNKKEELFKFGECLDTLSQYYDYIIADTIMDNVSVVKTLYKRANKVVMVVLQDIYEINTAYAAISLFDGESRITGKIIPLINRTVKKGVPELELVKGTFSSTECIMIPEDTFGFMQAYSVGKPYYLYAKRKIQDLYLNLLGKI